MSKDYAEILLQAVDTLYNKRVESIKFDTTDSATIIERVDADKGKYVVSTGTTKYVAYSVNTDYRVGDNVYVTIPNGDYEQQKIIIGKKVTNNSQPFVYTAPFDTIVKEWDEMPIFAAEKQLKTIIFLDDVTFWLFDLLYE